MAFQWLWQMFLGGADEKVSPGKDADDDWEVVDGSDAEFRLILVGKSGGGKSATGNTILGQKKFNSILAAETVTQKCQREQGKWEDHKISVVDTSAIFDHDYDESVCDDIRDCIKLSQPGPHALIFVTQVGRFGAGDVAAAKRVWAIFGRKSERRTIVLFTCVEDLGGDPLDEYVRMSDNRNLQELIARCGNRFCGFNNKAVGNERNHQVSKLMEKVRETIAMNSRRYYINELYQKTKLEDEHIRSFIEKNRQQDKSFIRILVETIIVDWLFSWFRNYDMNPNQGLPQLTAGISVTDPEDRETATRPMDPTPESDNEEVGVDVVSEAESQPGPPAPAGMHMSDAGEAEDPRYVELPVGTSG